MEIKDKVVQQLLTYIWGIAGMYNFIRAFTTLRKENKYIKQLLKENGELKEKIIQLEIYDSRKKTGTA